MTQLFTFRKFTQSMGKAFVLTTSSLVLMACKPDIFASDGEVSVDAKSGLVNIVPHGPTISATEPISLSFDTRDHFVTLNSSLLFRGTFLRTDRDRGHKKAGSLLIENRQEPWHGIFLTLPPLETKQPYRASMWIRLIDTDKSATVKLVLTQVVNSIQNNLTLNEVHIEPEVWHKIEGEFLSTQATGADLTALSLHVDQVDLKYLIDDILVSHADAEPSSSHKVQNITRLETEYVRNGDVEEGMEYWAHQGGIISRSTVHAHTGQHSLLISGRTQSWNAPVMPLFGLRSGRTYRISIFARLNDGESPSNMKLTLKRTASGRDSFFTLSSAHANNASWIEVAGNFSAMNISNHDRISVYLEAENPTASYFVDTLTVEDVTDD